MLHPSHPVRNILCLPDNQSRRLRRYLDHPNMRGYPKEEEWMKKHSLLRQSIGWQCNLPLAGILRNQAFRNRGLYNRPRREATH